MALVELEANTIVWLVICLVVILFVVKSLLPKRKPPWPHVKGGLPLLGNFLQVGGTPQIVNRVEEWAFEYGKDFGVFDMNLAGNCYTIVCRQDRAKEVLLKRPFTIIRDKHITEASRSIGATGVFSAEGSRWQADRRVVVPALNKNHVQDYMKHMVTMVDRLVKKWQDAKGDAVAVNQDIVKFTMDVTALSTSGKDFDSLRAHDSQDSKDIVRLFEAGFSRTLSPIPYWKIPVLGQFLDGAGWSRRRLLSSLEKIVDDSTSEISGGTFVEKAILQSKKDTSFTKERLVGNMLTMFVGGTDSNASTLCSAILALATDMTGLQNELAEEAAALPDLKDVTLDDIRNRVPRLRSFLYEIHRFYSAFPMIFFEAASDVELFGSVLPKGRQIIVMVRYIQKNPHAPATEVPLGPHGESHLEFCPRRYLLDKGKDVKHPERNSTSFLTFGHGSRICPGMLFSDAIVCLTLISLFRNFEWALKPDHEPIGRVMGLAEVTDKDVHVLFSKR